MVATEDVAKGVYLGHYTGQVMTKQALESKIASESGSRKLYVQPLVDNLVIDASFKGSICR